MNKSNSIKKVVLYSLVILYNIVSLFWCYALIKSLIFEFSTVKIGLNGIDIIGGADLPTLSFIMGGIFGCACSVLFVLLSLATVFLFTAAILKKQKNRKLGVWLCIFSVLTLIIFMLIPAYTYVVSLYALVRKISFLKHIQFIYIILSLMIIITNIFFTIKRSNKT